MSDPVTPLVTVRLDGDPSAGSGQAVAVLRIDNPPVNALDAGVRAALAAAVRDAEADPRARALVIVCAGRTFVAGADIAELERAAWGDGEGPDMHPLLAAIERCSKPVVAAIHGTAFGGGLELAMACHYRIAVESARLGLPEINLGIIPGAEGTQRLPRLVGVEKALEMGLSGKPIAAADALSSGLVDRIARGDLEAAAIAFAREVLERGETPPRASERADRIGTPEENETHLAAARETVRKTKPHLPAARAWVDAVEAAATLPFEAGRRRERELSAETVRSEPCKALLHVFLAERAAAKVPGVPKDVSALAGGARRDRRRRHDGRRDRDGVRECGDHRAAPRRDPRGARDGDGGRAPELRRLGQARPPDDGSRLPSGSHASRRSWTIPGSTRPT